MELNYNPKVSILIPTRNRTEFFKKSLQSILNQTYKNIEIIISDNFPENNETEKYVKSLENNNIIYIKQEKLISMVDHWNFLTEQSTGDYICIYHDDDIYSENIIETSLECFFKKDNVLMCHVYTKHFSNDINDPSTMNLLHDNTYMDNIEYLKYCIEKKPSIICSSVMYPAWIFKKYKFLEKYKSFDYHFWFQILQNEGYVAYNKKSLMYYRKHQNNTFKKYNHIQVQKEYFHMFCESISPKNKKYLNNYKKELEHNIVIELIDKELGLKKMINIFSVSIFIKEIKKYSLNISVLDFVHVIINRLKK